MREIIMRIAPGNMNGVIADLKKIDPNLQEIKRSGNTLVVRMRISITKMFNLNDYRIDSMVG